MVIDCELLFDAIQTANKQPYWLAGMILALDISQSGKYKLAKQLLKKQGVFNWFLIRLYGDDDAGE